MRRPQTGVATSWRERRVPRARYESEDAVIRVTMLRITAQMSEAAMPAPISLEAVARSSCGASLARDHSATALLLFPRWAA